MNNLLLKNNLMGKNSSFLILSTNFLNNQTKNYYLGSPSNNFLKEQLLDYQHPLSN